VSLAKAYIVVFRLKNQRSFALVH